MNIKSKKVNKASDYLGYALYAFGGLGIEILLSAIENFLYGSSYKMWSDGQIILHWMITCIIWGSLGLILKKQLKPICTDSIKKSNCLVGIIVFSISLIYTSFLWGGFKPIIEFSNLGMGKFLFQYMYYAFEALLILIIIAHGQKAFELWFKNIHYVPFGGILLAATWGLIHIFTQGSLTGLYTVIQGLLYGSIYLILNQNLKFSYIVITLMFML